MSLVFEKLILSLSEMGPLSIPLDKAFVRSEVGPVLQEWSRDSHTGHIYTFGGYSLQTPGRVRHGVSFNSTADSAYVGRCAKYAVAKHI